MSRQLDWSKPLKEWDPEELRYAADRDLFSEADSKKVHAYLARREQEPSEPKVEELAPAPGPEDLVQEIEDEIAANEEEADAEGDTEDGETAEAYDPSEHGVSDVLEYLAANPDEAEAVLAAERAGKGRKGILGE